MTASDDRPARGFIQLFRPGLLVLLEALKVSFCHSSHRPPPLLCHFLLSVQQAGSTNATILPTSSCFVVVHFCDILFSSVISPQIPEICASLLLLFIPSFLSCFFLLRLPFFLFRFLLFPLQSLQTGFGRHPHSLRFFRTVGHKGLLLSGICVHSPWGLQTVVLRLLCGLLCLRCRAEE